MCTDALMSQGYGYTRATSVVDLVFLGKKNPNISVRVFRFKASRCPTLTWGDPKLPSALSSFTSEFEMGSGGSYLLLSRDKLVGLLVNNSTKNPKLESHDTYTIV